MKETILIKRVWDDTALLDYAPLTSDVSCQVLVIGGGMAGILTAYELSLRGYEVVVAEANKIGGGATKNTTAVITSQHGLIYREIAKKYGLDMAKSFYSAQEYGIKLYDRLIKENSIDCDFIKTDGYQYATLTDKIIKKEYQVLNKIGASITYQTKLEELPLSVVGVIKQPDQAQFDPLKFLSALPKPFTIYESTRIKKVDIKTKTAYADNGTIHADKIIIATNFPVIDFPNFSFIKQYQSTSYALAVKGAKIKGVYNDEEDDGFTLRQYKDYVIVGGSDHRTGRNKYSMNFEKLSAFAEILFPSCKIECGWLGEDSVTYDNIPIAGRLAKGVTDIYSISGFNKWGMTNSIVCAKLIADLIDNVPNEYEKLYSAKRGYFLPNLGSFIKCGLISVGNLTKSFLYYPIKKVNSLAKGSGDVFMIKGKKCAVYRDEQDELHIISARCKHLGCQLVFNPSSKTWDCPCHGTRLDIDGNVISAPATEGNKSPLTDR